nr:GNAT family N-acetyltransferase [Microlunatus panaciterrae]
MILRRFTAADVDHLASLDKDPDVMRYINGGRATSRQEIADEVLPSLLSYYNRPDGFGYWAAIEKSTGLFIGWFHLRPPGYTTDGAPEIGYRLRRSEWRKGFATEGCRALIRKAFTELGVERVVAEMLFVNKGARRVMEKCGMHHVRTFQSDWPDAFEGAELGDVEYAAERDDWLIWDKEN